MFSFFKKANKSTHSHEHARHSHGGGCCGGGHSHEGAVDEQHRGESDVVASVADRESPLSASAPAAAQNDDTHG